MAIEINLDLMMAKRQMSLTELSERVGITMSNLSILKQGHARAIRLSTLDKKDKHFLFPRHVEFPPLALNSPSRH